MEWKVECQAKVRNSMSCATQCPTTLPKNLGLNGQNYNTILVMVNRFIKMANFILTIKYLNIISLAYLMDRQIYLRYGVPKSIINDCNPLFTSKF